jgi:hypothetical protein
MSRYFFRVYHDRDELDDEGEELPDKHAAWQEATVTAGQILQGLGGRLKPSCTSVQRNQSKAASVGGLHDFLLVWSIASDKSRNVLVC